MPARIASGGPSQLSTTRARSGHFFGRIPITENERLIYQLDRWGDLARLRRRALRRLQEGCGGLSRPLPAPDKFPENLAEFCPVWGAVSVYLCRGGKRPLLPKPTT